MTHFWAKTTLDGEPGLSVFAHMVNVGHVAQFIAETSPEVLRRFDLHSPEVGALAGLHDLGKISPGFQRKCAVWLAENDLVKVDRNCCWDTSMESDHGKVSHSAIQAFLTAAAVERKAAKFVSAVLGAHHGRLTPPNDRGYLPQRRISETFSKIDWDAERLSAAQAVWGLFGASNPMLPNDNSPSLWWLAGLTSVADWIGSDERFFSPDRSAAGAFCSAQAKNALNEIGFFSPALLKGLKFEALFDFHPNEMQEKALATINGPGVYVIEAPMGMGKTDAALGVAYQLLAAGKAKGIYFALPTQATSNRIHLRMNEFLQRIAPDSSCRLIHSNSWLMSSSPALVPAPTVPRGLADDDARAGRDWFSSAKRALIAPFGVGTVDQALLGVVAAKHFFVRHFALAGKVVILDEVPSYDVYTGTLIDKLITTLEGLGCTVIVLSATLTAKRRGQLVSASHDLARETEVAYPLITGRRDGELLAPVAAEPPPSRTVLVEFLPASAAEKEAAAVAQNGGAVLWICNTVGSAQEQFRRFQSQGLRAGLLHSRYPFWRREALEAEWMQRLGKNGKDRCASILVSTQVVEQSVDLDADLLVTELAPSDMLLQRIGRLWRHERKQRPVAAARVCVLEEARTLEDFRTLAAPESKKALGGKAFVYDPFILLRTLEVWKRQQEIRVPEQIRWLIEATYEDHGRDPESWQNLQDEMLGKMMAYRQKALMNSNIWQVTLNDEEGVQTRLNEMPTVALVLCRFLSPDEAVFLDGTSARLGAEKYQLPLAQAIHRNLVKVPRHCFDGVEPFCAFEEYLHGDYCAGVVASNETVVVEGLRNRVRLTYSDESGLSIGKEPEGKNE